MIDSLTEDLLTFAMAAQEVPGQSGRGVNVSTIWRWSLRGIRGIKLESLMIGGVRHTSREALQRFFEATTAAADGASAPTQGITAASRKLAIEQAEKELDGVPRKSGRSVQVSRLSCGATNSSPQTN